MHGLCLVLFILGTRVAVCAQHEAANIEQRARDLRQRFADRSTADDTHDRELTVAALARIIKEESENAGKFSTTKAQALAELGKYSDVKASYGILLIEIDYGHARYVDSSPPITHYPAAMSLIKSGIASRGRILRALGEHQSDQRLSLMVSVLVELDQDTDGLEGEYSSRTALTMLRLTQELEQVKWRPVADELQDERLQRMKNLERMIALLTERNFGLKRP